MREEPGAVLAAIFGAEGVPIGAAGTLQALGRTWEGPGTHPLDKHLPAAGLTSRISGTGAEIPGTQRMPNDWAGSVFCPHQQRG